MLLVFIALDVDGGHCFILAPIIVLNKTLFLSRDKLEKLFWHDFCIREERKEKREKDIKLYETN